MDAVHVPAAFHPADCGISTAVSSVAIGARCGGSRSRTHSYRTLAGPCGVYVYLYGHSLGRASARSEGEWVNASDSLFRVEKKRWAVKSGWITLAGIVAAILFLLLSRRLDLLVIVVPLSAFFGWLARRDSVSGQRRI